MPDTTEDRELVSEFADALRDAGGPHAFVGQLAEMKGWANAFGAACEAADEMPPDADGFRLMRAGAVHVVRGLYKTMRERGISTPWPLRFGDAPQIAEIVSATESD